MTMIYKSKFFRTGMNLIMLLLTLCCIFPFLLLVASSFSSEALLAQFGYSVIPRGFTAAAYEYIWGIKASILRAYFMSFVITFIGTPVSVIMTLLFAYPLSRKELPGRKIISFFLFFTMLFNGGFVPTYLVYSNIFHVTDSLSGMIVPYLLMNAFYVIMMRTYIMTNVPVEVLEASMIDGANEFQNLLKIVIPMSKPILGTIALMSAIAYWNNWTNGVYFIQMKRSLYGIQNYLNSVISNVAFLQTHSSAGINAADLPSISIRMALAVIAIIPILIAYPFFQKSFVAGITIGSVKG